MPEESDEPKPLKLASLNVIICEKLLKESDGVISAIRMVDIFYFRRDPESAVPKQGIPICFLASGRFPPGDTDPHSVALFIVRPEGDVAPLGEPMVTSMEAKLTNASLLAEGSEAPAQIAGGFNFVAEIGLIPKQTGLHYLVVFVDGNQVARVPFSILELKSQTDH